MSTYIKISTLEYPRHEGDIRLDYPDIAPELTGDSFPCPEDYAPVLIQEPPNVNWNSHLAYASEPVCVNGEWSISWNIRPLTQGEIDARKAAHEAAMQNNQMAEPDLTVSGSAPNVIT